MGFVVAVRGRSRVKVSEKVFENTYKKRGYRIEGQRDQVSTKKKQPDKQEEEQGSSVPISDMNEEELRAYAWEHDVDISGAKSVAEIRKTIQKSRQI